MKVWPHLADAGLMVALLIALAFGADVRWIVGILIICEAASCLCKAFVAFMSPVVQAFKALNQIPRGG